MAESTSGRSPPRSSTALSPVGQHNKEPTPTGAWFTNLLLDDGAPSATTPYAVRFEKKTHALEICYPSSHRAITKDNVVDAFVADLIVKTEKLASPELVSHDELTAEFKFGDARAHFARARRSSLLR